MLTLPLCLLLTQLPTGPVLLAAPLDAQRTRLERLTPAQRTEVVRSLSLEQLIALEQRAAQSLGTYRARVVRSERIDGQMLPLETMQVFIRPQPLAIRLETVEGTKKGRKVLYNAALRKDELRAQESGFLGVFGGVWVGLDSRLTRSDSNHRLTDLGFAPVMGLIERILNQTRAQGELTRTYVRTDETGVCERFDAPAGARGLYATRSLICFDPVSSLPMHFEIADAKGPLERYTYSQVEAHLKLPDAFFTPAAAGL